MQDAGVCDRTSGVILARDAVTKHILVKVGNNQLLCIMRSMHNWWLSDSLFKMFIRLDRYLLASFGLCNRCTYDFCTCVMSYSNCFDLLQAEGLEQEITQCALACPMGKSQ